MLLSPETFSRISTAARGSSTYLPNEETSTRIGTKSLIEFIGPAAGGKSTLMGEVLLIDDTFSYVTGFTSREEEIRDVPGRYTYWNSDAQINQLIDRIEDGTVVQYAVHPTTKNFYGSFPEDYHTKYAMLDALFNSVDDLDRLAFESIFKIAVVSRGKEWIGRFLERYPTLTEERTKRIQEAKLCLEWMQNQPKENLLWIENRENQAAKAAQATIQLIKFGGRTDNLSSLASEMYNEALKVST